MPSFSIVPVKPSLHQHANRPDDARLVDVNAVGRGGDVVAARRADVLDDGIERNIGVLGAQPLHFIRDVSGLHRAAPRAIDAQDHALGALVLERVLQPRHHVFRAGRRIG
jgi:hypothetical protein